MKVLVINSGSSSLKFELINTEENETLAKGICERIGISNPIFTFKNLVTGFQIKDRKENFENHKLAINVVLNELTGENAALAREGICKGLEFLGIELDYDKNNERIDENVEYSKKILRLKYIR